MCAQLMKEAALRDEQLGRQRPSAQIIKYFRSHFCCFKYGAVRAFEAVEIKPIVKANLPLISQRRLDVTFIIMMFLGRVHLVLAVECTFIAIDGELLKGGGEASAQI